LRVALVAGIKAGGGVVIVAIDGRENG
jgi:hypothetical protein